MPIFRLSDRLIFPNPCLADNGLLAVGGDLTPERLLLAYSKGIFPWYSARSPILWWSPDPRLILLPADIKISNSLQRTIRSGKYTIKTDTCFSNVIELCGKVARRDQPGTWITNDMVNAYCHLHELGHAHSVEAFEGNKLVGGLYGVSIGAAFFGESMFSISRDSSKVALCFLAKKLHELHFDLIDAQQSTAHLKSMGAKEISREEFLIMLEVAVEKPGIKGKWSF